MFLRQRDIFLATKKQQGLQLYPLCNQLRKEQANVLAVISNLDLKELEEVRQLKRERGLNLPSLSYITHLLKTEDAWWLSLQMPIDCRHNWTVSSLHLFFSGQYHFLILIFKLLHSNLPHGERDWEAIVHSIDNKGPTLLIVQDIDNCIFGKPIHSGYSFPSPSSELTPSLPLLPLRPPKVVFVLGVGASKKVLFPRIIFFLPFAHLFSFFGFSSTSFLFLLLFFLNLSSHSPNVPSSPTQPTCSIIHEEAGLVIFSFNCFEIK